MLSMIFIILFIIIIIIIIIIIWILFTFYFRYKRLQPALLASFVSHSRDSWGELRTRMWAKRFS